MIIAHPSPKRQRLVRLAKLADNAHLQALELAKCRRDIHYWFEHYAWTYDPRIDPVTKKPAGPIPFLLYDFQSELVSELCQHINDGQNLILEKARDMGATWVILAVFLHYYLFHKDSNFIVATYLETLVDSQGDMKSLFPKLRLMVNMLPAWMRPQGFAPRYHSGHMKLLNPGKNSSITGDSINNNLGRSGRALAVFIDEMAFARCNDQAAYESVIQTAPCIIMISTANGKRNHYYRLMYDPKLEAKPDKLRLEWHQNPQHDEAWMEAQKRKYTKSGLAREVLINYSDSMEGAVFQNFNTRYHVPDDPPKFPDPDMKVIVAFDFGGTCAAIVSQLDPYGRLHVFREFVLYPEDKPSTKALGIIVRSYLSQPPAGHQPIPLDLVYVTADPGGRNKLWMDDPDESKAAFDVLALLGFPSPRINKLLSTRNRLTEGVELLVTLFNERMNGTERITIDSSCKTLIEALEGEYHYHTTPNGEITDQVKETHPYEDVVDVLRYTALQFMSVYNSDKQSDEGIAQYVYFPV